MKKLLTALGFILCFSQLVYAGQTYNWKIPNSIRIVQKDPVDNVTTFSSLSSAVASITGASETDPVMVIIMPGTYWETVSIPPYVSIMGLDKANTILKNSGGAISLTSNSSAKNLTFYSAFGTNGTPLNLLNGTNILLENVSVDNESDHGEALYINNSSGIEIRDSDFTAGITVNNSTSVLIRDSQVFNTTKSWVPIQAALTEINGSSVEVQSSYFDVPIGYY
jgi:pectin methylesterase-like acyl-CoA thioesterase